MKFSKPFVIAQMLFFGLAVVLGALYIQKLRKPHLPVMGTIADFQLKDQYNQNIGLNDLKGRVWVADFIFTSCGNLCPLMSKNMAALQKDFASFKDVRFVSISVNPDTDTPVVLQRYAQKYKATDGQWLFLTGPIADIQKLAMGSFKMGDMKDVLFHSSFFALVDRQGHIRGYYEGTDPNRLAQLRKDLSLLRGER